MSYKEKYQEWCSNPYFDEETRNELIALKENEAEISDRFYKDLEFGTGGLRGVLGNGTNRMNIYTVRKATQGLANFIIKKGGQEKGVAIAYDSRIMSTEFAQETALCLAANGIKAYVFPSLRPTPELSFAVRELKCTAGIVITASHNPSDYNGYKVYWEDGAQITYPLDKDIIAEVNRIDDFAVVKTISKEEAIEKNLYHVIGEEIDDKYIAELRKLVLNPNELKEYAKQLTVVYTPLHGTGLMPVTRILKEIGFENVHVVSEQEQPDGRFPTVSYPNPEDKKAFTLALELAKKVDADIILATDPDADRLGVYAKNKETGEYVSFTGNMSGLLICEYELDQRRKKGTLPDNGAIVTTIVSSNMAAAVAKDYGVHYIETLTGFKFIGEQIKFFEEQGTYEYLFGFEESYGCLIGTYARDKDAIIAVMALCEAAAYYKAMNLTLWDQMLHIFNKYGYYMEDLYTITLQGADGAQKIGQIMEKFRNNPPKTVAGCKVKVMRDYKADKVYDLETGATSATGLPVSNVLYFELENDYWFCVRPSGTEPKIKFYTGVKCSSIEESQAKLSEMKESISAYVEDKPEIFFLEGVFKETIWGGERLRKEYAYKIPSDTTGEYWAVSAHENGDSSVVGVAYQGLSLSSLWKNHRELFGNLEGDRFPLLVKIIDAKQDLSIQVHPDDSYAKIHENGSFGKTECWYILDCDENASIVIGHNARTKEELTDMIHQGRWTELIREIPIRKGDFFQINPGTVHAIKGGTMILETQQNSDITYRVYDYDRMTDGKKRELHIEKSIDVIDTPNIVETKTLTSTEDSTQVLISCSYYTVEKRDITKCESFNQDKAFQILSVIEGEGMINDTPIRRGDHFVLPYKFGEYTLSGNMSLICSYL